MALAIQNNLFGNVPVPAPEKATPAEASIKDAAVREHRKPEYKNRFGQLFADPRPDIDGDSDLWVTLLVAADLIDPRLSDSLFGFRCVGARLLPTEDGKYVMRPHIDPSGDCGFRSQEDYRDEATRWLQPFAPQFKLLLANLAEANKKWWGLA